MRCPVCTAIPGRGECAECRALAEEISANRAAMAGLRDEELPSFDVRTSGRASAYSWLAAVTAAAAAAVLLVTALPHPWRPAHTPPPAEVSRVPRLPVNEPLKIKMLTSDPDVVIYWLIDSKQGE
jgi:hypothetical protein